MNPAAVVRNQAGAGPGAGSRDLPACHGAPALRSNVHFIRREAECLAGTGAKFPRGAIVIPLPWRRGALESAAECPVPSRCFG